MSGICSVHAPQFGVAAGCAACHASLEDLLGVSEVIRMRAEAKAAGSFTCDCGFEYYKTVDSCPLCDKERKIILP